MRNERDACPRIFATADGPDVGGIVCSSSGRDLGILEKLLFDCEGLDIRGRKEHDINNSLSNDVSNLRAIVFQRFPVAFIILGPDVAVGARCGNAKRHIGVFGVSDDKSLAPGRVRMDVREFWFPVI